MKKRYSYLGLDAHSDHCQVAVVSPDGNVISCKSYPTCAPELIEAVNNVKGHKKLVVEESQMADWVKRTLEPYVDELIIADPKVNAWIAKAQHMDDRIAAIKLAHLLRGNFINPVHHGDSDRQQFKELVLHYYDMTRHAARFKCKLKSEFIAKAINVKGATIYNQVHFPCFCEKLKHYPETLLQVKSYFAIIQQFEFLKAKTLKRIRSFYKKYPEIQRIMSIDGVGQVTAFTIVAIIDTPSRFSNKKKLYAYCSLANSTKISNNKKYFTKPTSAGNRLIKGALLNAAKAAISSKRDTFITRKAQQLLTQGVSVKNTRRSVGRHIISAAINIWLKGETYRPPKIA